MKVQPIIFSSDPKRITAFVTYMGGEYRLPKWDLSDGKYKHRGLQEQVQKNNVKKINVLELSFKNNEIQNILSQVKNIMFPNLKVLNLQGNKISSIENLCRIALPVVTRIDLTDNNVINIKSLRKANIAEIRQLSFKKNQIRSLGRLSQLCSQNLREITLEQYLRTDECQGQCLKFAFKLQAKSLQWLVATNSSRIGFQYRKMGKKYKEMCLRVYEKNARRRGPIVRPLIQW